MAVESHLAFGDEPESPRSRGGFEAGKNRKELGERELAHTVIWERSDSDPKPPKHEQVKPTAKAEAGPPKVARQNPESAARPAVEIERHAEKPKESDPAQLKIKHEHDANPAPAPKNAEVAAAKTSQPEQLADLLKLRELPTPADMRRERHEPQARPHKAAGERRDALPQTSPSNENQPRMQESRGSADRKTEQQPDNARPRAERPNTGEQLQHIAEQTAERAAELADRHRTPPERSQEHADSKVATEAPVPQNRPAERASGAGEPQMRAPELYKLSQSIRVEGVSVAEMFAARRIDEAGLRRIVSEFLRGRNVEKIITEEVVRLQIKFELDPQLRRKRSIAGRAAAGKAAGRIKAQTKKLANPKRAKHGLARLSSAVLAGLDEAREIIDENPRAAKMVGGAAIVLIYTTILILLITH